MPLQRVRVSEEGKPDAPARLQTEQAGLDPFELNRRIDGKLGALYDLAHRRLIPVRASARCQPAATAE
jgi:hypothetical protein